MRLRELAWNVGGLCLFGVLIVAVLVLAGFVGECLSALPVWLNPIPLDL